MAIGKTISTSDKLDPEKQKIWDILATPPKQRTLLDAYNDHWAKLIQEEIDKEILAELSKMVGTPSTLNVDITIKLDKPITYIPITIKIPK